METVVIIFAIFSTLAVIAALAVFLSLLTFLWLKFKEESQLTFTNIPRSFGVGPTVSDESIPQPDPTVPLDQFTPDFTKPTTIRIKNENGVTVMEETNA